MLRVEEREVLHIITLVVDLDCVVRHDCEHCSKVAVEEGDFREDEWDWEREVDANVGDSGNIYTPSLGSSTQSAHYRR
jgi:hypothetical protein